MKTPTEKSFTKLRRRAFGQFAAWSKPDLSHLSPFEKEQYSNKYKAMLMYCEGEPLCEIENITGLSKQLVVYYVKKCLTIAEHGEPWGCLALLPYQHTVPYERTNTLQKKLPDAKGGYAGILSYTLNRYPELEERLVAEIRKIKSQDDGPYEKKISAKNLHDIFTKVLLALGASKHEWPFNTKYQGERSISRYMNFVLDENFGRAVNVRSEHAAKVHAQVGQGKRTLVVALDPYDVVELDSYYFDCKSTVAFMTPEGTKVLVPIERLWLIGMIDRASKAYLAYKVVYRNQVSAADVIDVFRRALSPTHERPLQCVEGLHYPSDGGLPLEVIPECRHALWTVLMLDNALAHLSKKISELARKELGFALNYGPVGFPMRRPNIERSFKELAKDIFGRLPSTTGSNPQNGRAEDAEKAALKYKIEACEIEHVLDVEIAQHNCRPSEGLSFLSPLEFIKEKLLASRGHLILRKMVDVDVQNCNCILQVKETVYVRGGRDDGRLPYVQVDRVRYTNGVLKDASMLIGKPVVVAINEADMRTIRAFTIDGHPLGVLVACGRWADVLHDRRTRKAINSLLSKKILHLASTDNPVTVLMEHLGRKNKEQGSRGAPISAARATEAKRVADAAGVLPFITESDNKRSSVPERKISDVVVSSGLGRPMPDLNILLKSRVRP